MPLWLFMIAVTRADSKQICLSWKKYEKYEFMVKDRELLAKLWGLLKGNSAMDYAKLSRALRYYYKKDLIEKVADQPYTYRFIVSEKTLLYLPTQDDLLKNRIIERAERPANRPKSLPDFLSVFNTVLTKDSQSVSCSSFVLTNSELPLQYGEKKFALKRERTESLPPTLMLSRQDSDGSSWIASTDSSSDVPLSPKDELMEFSWLDAKDGFAFRERTTPEKVPETAIFKPGDLPLLNFEDLLKLEDDLPICCSPLSIEGSDRSCDVELCEDTSFWIYKMNENPELNLSLALELGKYEESRNAGDKTGPETKVDINGMDMDTEMDIVQQVIGENDA